MKTKYLKYRSVEEILDTLEALPFKKFKKKQIERILTSNSPLEYKVETILEQRGWGKTFKMLVHAIYKAQEEKVLVLTYCLDNGVGLKSTIDSLLKKLDLNVKDNLVIKTINQPCIGFNNVFIDSACKPTQEQLNNLKAINLYYKPVN